MASSSPRPRCSVFIAQSLDGFIARPDGGLDWLATVERPGEDYGFRAFFDSIDTLVVGRKTHDVARGFEPWPYQGKRCIVLTRATPLPTFTHGERAFAGSLTALMTELASEGAQHVYVDGGAVIRQFLDAGLVDELTLSVIPLLLGDGVRLFGGTTGDVPLELVRAQSFASGLVQLVYRLPERGG